MNFGEMIKDLRIGRGLTLRQFCADFGADPSNWSKLERNIVPPPRDSGFVEVLADFFELKGAKRQELLDAAALARRELPQDMASDERILSALPAFFRALRGKELKGEKLQQFIEDIRALHSPSK